jgi:adenine phosphoribosyltransferase
MGTLLDRVEKVIGKDAIGRYDLIPVFKNIELFSEIIDVLAEPFVGKIDYVVAPESLGWILGVAISNKLKVGFVPLRKENKLPYPKEKILRVKFVDYTKNSKTLEIVNESVPPKSKIIIVDEWIETGETMKACIKIMEKMNCDIMGLAAIGIDENENTKNWIENGFVKYIGKNI